MKALGAVGETALFWGPILPGLLLFLAAWWAWSGKAARFLSSGSGSPLRWFPWMRTMIANAEAANFAQLLSILIAHGVPYPQAVRLASEATGDPKLLLAGREVAAAVERGDLHAVAGGARGIPPLLRWILISGQGQGRLADSLGQIATIYRKRALYQAEKLKVFLPTLMLLAIGVTATLLYALTFFIPMSELLRGLAVTRQLSVRSGKSSFQGWNAQRSRIFSRGFTPGYEQSPRRGCEELADRNRLCGHCFLAANRRPRDHAYDETIGFNKRVAWSLVER